MTGIYRIKNMITGKCYVGKSEVNIEGRWKDHIRYLRNDKHRCSNGKPDKLQYAWNKYGEENFIFGIIEEYSPEQCNEMERYWIAYYDSFHNGYNSTEGGDGISGWNHSEETRQKISEGNKGKQYSPETRRKMSENHADMSGEKHPMYGKKHSPEARRKMSKNHADVSGEKNPMYGKKCSEKTRRKMSENNAGEKNPMYIPRTPEMYEDVQNNMHYKVFCAKYSVSGKIYNSIKKELKGA